MMRQVRVAATAEIGESIRRGMVARRILDGVVRNVFASDVGKLAAWASASHVERAPKKKGGSDSGGSGDGNPPA